MALSENPSIQELKELAQQHADLEVTREDSINAGNCESGTDNFLEEYFPERTSIKMSELVPYIDDYQGVRDVLEYKFRKLDEKAADGSAQESEDNSEDNPPF